MHHSIHHTLWDCMGTDILIIIESDCGWCRICCMCCTQACHVKMSPNMRRMTEARDEIGLLVLALSRPADPEAKSPSLQSVCYWALICRRQGGLGALAAGMLASSRRRTLFSYSALRRMVSQAPHVAGAAGTLSPALTQPGSTDIWQHTALLSQVSQRVSSRPQERTRQPLLHVTWTPNALLIAAFLQRKCLYGVSGPTSASQLAARKKGVENRSLLLTTLCSVDLKRPLVHLQSQEGNSISSVLSCNSTQIPQKSGARDEPHTYRPCRPG